MKTTLIWAVPSMGAALLAVPIPASGQDQGIARAHGPTPATIARMQAREADDSALLLNLRAGQRPALLAFLASMSPPPPPPMQRERAQDGPARDESGTMPPGEGFVQHLDRMTQDAAWRSAEDARRIAAARTFYDSLDPRQRRAFEALMRVRHGMGAWFGPKSPGAMEPGMIMQGGMRPGGDGSRPPRDAIPPRP